MSVRIALVSFTGIFEYSLVMSRDASVKCGAIGVSRNFWSRSVVFLHNNSFPITLQKHLHNNTINATRLKSTQMTKRKWVTFTYTGKETL